MKPDDTANDSASGDSDQVTGDVIGDTAYSERFVLKILLKLANLDTLKEEVQEKSFEDDLCTLWDMTAERDVVLFLQKHDILNLVNFALPVIESPRMIEIIVGIIGNICCQKEAAAEILKMESFVTAILSNMKTDDSLVLIQILRFVSSSLFLSDDENVAVWLGLFEANEYSSSLYFILKNSSHKDLLVTALENLNTVCSYCNIVKLQTDFYDHFVTVEALESLSVAFTEVTVNFTDLCEKDVLERIIIISLQIMLNFVGFDRSLQVYSESKNEISKIISGILSYHENKLVSQKEIDSDLVDVIESTNTILTTMNIVCEPNVYFSPAFSMWQALKVMKDNHNQSDFEEDDRKDILKFSELINQPLSTLLCIYLKSCSEDNLIKAVTDLEVKADYDTILSVVENKELASCVSKRTANHRTRLKENVDS